MRPTGYTYGNVQKNMLNALREKADDLKHLHPILEDVHFSIRKLPVDSIQSEKQVVLQKTVGENVYNGFRRWQEFSLKVYAPTIQELIDLCDAIEGMITVIGGNYGIAYCEVIMSAADVDNAMSVFADNQSLLEEEKVIIFDALISPVKFDTE